MSQVVVLGGGIVGLCSAYELLVAGFQVTVVEGRAPEDELCSNGNAGMIVPSHFIPLAAPGMVGLGMRMMFRPGSPFGFSREVSLDLLRWALAFAAKSNQAHVDRSAGVLLALNLLSRARYLELASELGGFTVEEKGLVMVCEKESTFNHEKKVAAAAASLGLRTAALTGAELAEVEPGLSPHVAGAVHFLDDAQVRPEAVLAALRAKIVALGGILRYRERAVGWEPGARAIRTTLGTLSADHFVIAGGTWSNDLTSQLGTTLPLQPGKGYSFLVPKSLAIGAILVEARVAVSPLGGETRVSGTMELGAWNDDISPARLAGIRDSFARHYPSVSRSSLDRLPVWKGHRPCTPDGMPLIGALPDHPHIVVATGHAMMGMSLGPVTGVLVKELILGKDPTIDLSPLRPNR